MNINWKVRLRNKTFWLAIIPFVVLFANQVADLFGFDIKLYSDKITAIVMTVLSILVGVGVLVDPTTDGVSDSNQAMTYNKPKE